MAVSTPSPSHWSVRDLSVLAACLAFVSYAVPLLIDILGGNLLSGPHPGYIFLLLVVTLLPGSLGVLAACARRRRPVRTRGAERW